jgi:3-dehydroquinate dehydratase-2
MVTDKHHVLILNGPNLNMLGEREPALYGTTTLAEIAVDCEEYAAELGITIDFRQSNSEGDLVTLIQQAKNKNDGLIINAGAYAHSSIAIHDALKMVDLPVIEVHLTNIYARESFRHHSYIAPVAHGTITGFGAHGYIMAIDAMKNLIDNA